MQTALPRSPGLLLRLEVVVVVVVADVHRRYAGSVD
jgi:hypothetical protein